MKRIEFLLMLIVVLLCNACKRDDDTNPSTNTKKYYIKFKINNVQKEDYITTTQSNGSIGYFDESSIFEQYNNVEYRFQLRDGIATMHPVFQILSAKP